jgi:SAM-dependent methyltransferase
MSLRQLLRGPHARFSRLFFDPWDMLKRWRGLPHFYRNRAAYDRLNRRPTFSTASGERLYRSYDRYAGAGSVPTHYFQQDLWAARRLLKRGVTSHVDVGSRLDGFVAHALTFAEVTFVDIRPLTTHVDRLHFEQGSITSLPFADQSVDSLSSLHVIEHIGLGRYGDPVDPDGHIAAARELARILRPGGELLIGTPVGRERLVFDGHRIFDPHTVVNIFPTLELRDFALVGDDDMLRERDVSLDDGAQCEYGCGLFAFAKPAS